MSNISMPNYSLFINPLQPNTENLSQIKIVSQNQEINSQIWQDDDFQSGLKTHTLHLDPLGIYDLNSLLKTEYRPSATQIITANMLDNILGDGVFNTRDFGGTSYYLSPNINPEKYFYSDSFEKYMALYIQNEDERETFRAQMAEAIKNNILISFESIGQLSFANSYEAIDKIKVYNISSDYFNYFTKSRTNKGFIQNDNVYFEFNPSSKDLINNFINSYGKSNLIETKFGKAEIFLDIDSDGIIGYNGKELLKANYELFNLDSNHDAVLDKNDEYFNKLKIRAYDKDGNEIIKKLSEISRKIDLRTFIKTQDEILDEFEEYTLGSDNSIKETTEFAYKALSNEFYGLFRAEIRYEEMSLEDIKIFAQNADENGWINVEDLYNSNKFKSLQSNIHLAYAKVGFDGEIHLEELFVSAKNLENLISGLELDGTPKNAGFDPRISDTKEYIKDQNKRFLDMYNDYKNELKARDRFIASLSKEEKAAVDINSLKSSAMIQIEDEFTKATKMKFSLANLEKVFQIAMKNPETLANKLTDTDYIKAIRVNENGTFMLRFTSGREIIVSKLYKENRTMFHEGNLPNLNLKNIDFDVSKFDKSEFAKIAVKHYDIDENNAKIEKISTLKELGVKAIHAHKDKDQMILELENGEKIATNKRFYERLLKENNQVINQIFYPKPTNILA